jgi:hypothetical protein
VRGGVDWRAWAAGEIGSCSCLPHLLSAHTRADGQTAQVRSGQARSGRRAGVIVGTGGCWCGMDMQADRRQAGKIGWWSAGQWQ